MSTPDRETRRAALIAKSLDECYQRGCEGEDREQSCQKDAPADPQTWCGTCLIDALQREIREQAERIATLTAQVEQLERERNDLLLDRHNRDGISECGHYRVFTMPCVDEEGEESPCCMQCNRDQLVAQVEQQAQELARLREALESLIIDANRLCDRMEGGTYEDDCRRTLAKAKEALK